MQVLRGSNVPTFSAIDVEVPNQPGLLCVLNVGNPSARAADMDTPAGHGTCPIAIFKQKGTGIVQAGIVL